MPGLKRIVEAVHGEGVPLLLQIHHAGVVSETEDPVCPSDYSLVFKGKGAPWGRGSSSVEEIQKIEGDFIEAARRAYEAGYDGVELHGWPHVPAVPVF